MKHVDRMLMLLFLLGCVAPVSAGAQEADPIEVRYGMRVRVAYHDAEVWEDQPLRRDGLYLGRSEDSIILADGDGHRTRIPTDSVESVEVSVKPGNRGFGVRTAGLIGFAAGAIVGAASAAQTSSDDDVVTISPLGAGLLTGAITGVIGMVVGGLVASGEQWEDVPVENLEIGIASRREMGTGLALGFSF